MALIVPSLLGAGGGGGGEEFVARVQQRCIFSHALVQVVGDLKSRALDALRYASPGCTLWLEPSECDFESVDEAIALLNLGVAKLVVDASSALLPKKGVAKDRLVARVTVKSSTTPDELHSLLESLADQVADILLTVESLFSEVPHPAETSEESPQQAENSQTLSESQSGNPTPTSAPNEASERLLKSFVDVAQKLGVALSIDGGKAGRPSPEEVKSMENERLLKSFVDVAQKLGVKLSIDGGKAGRPSPEQVKSMEKLGVTLLVNSEIEDLIGRCFVSTLVCKRVDGLFPAVVCDEQGVCLGLAYSSTDSIREAIKQAKGVYYSRSRKSFWIKGLTSGATQRLLRIDVDCDKDTVRYTVTQTGTGFCHVPTQRTCFGPEFGLGKLFRTLKARKDNPQPKSYTNRLLNDQELLTAKLQEECKEFIDAQNSDPEPEHVANEAADLIYFTAVKCISQGVSLADIERQLEYRTRRATRRKGDAKPQYLKKKTEESK